jgi:hypothetical protein
MDQETLVQVGVSAMAVVLFIAGLAVFSMQYGSSANGGVELSVDGSFAIVALIAVFVVAMPIFGYAVKRVNGDFD